MLIVRKRVVRDYGGARPVRGLRQIVAVLAAWSAQQEGKDSVGRSLRSEYTAEDVTAGFSLAREIGNSPDLAFMGLEVAPGPLSEPELEQFFRDGLGKHWHQSGTAKVGRDEMSVVDGKLRVHGFDAL